MELNTLFKKTEIIYLEGKNKDLQLPGHFTKTQNDCFDEATSSLDPNIQEIS